MSGDPIRVPPRNRRLRVAAVVLAAAVLALWIQREFRPVKRMISALRSGEPAARLAAAEELGRVGSDEAPTAIPALADALKDPDGRVAAAAAAALERVGGNSPDEAPAAIPALADALRDPDGRVAAAVATALGRVGGVALRDPGAKGLARVAAEALG